MFKNIKIILTSEPNYKEYSIESGKADNKKHFDHHGQFEQYPSPCNNNLIKPITEDNTIIEITHMDADTYCGILRLLGKVLPKIDLSLLEQIDNNGSSICKDKFNPTLLYMVGIGQLQRDLGFPRCSEDRKNVTNMVIKMFKYTTEEIINIGRETQKKAEESYKNCLFQDYKNKALFVVDSTDALDPSRAYEDDIDVVIVYRKHYKTISIYCNPTSNYQFGNTTVVGIEFGGHPQACGSPRGIEMSLKQAIEVFKTIKL